MQTNRRKFLKTTAVSAAATLASPLFADQKSTAGEDYKALVCVMLEGGADSLNMVIPKARFDDYLAYAGVRGRYAVSREQSRALRRTAYGLHPNMARMQRLFNYDKMAIVANVGVLHRPLDARQIQKANTAADLAAAAPDQLFSHVAQREHWMSAGAEDGWAARVAREIGGEFVNISVGGHNTMQSSEDHNPFIAHDDIFGTHPAMGQIRRAAVDTYFEDDGSFEGKSLGEQLQMVLDLIEHRKAGGFAKRQIYFVSDGGWDLHSQERDNQVRFAQKVSSLDRSLGEFSAALERLGLGEKVTTCTMSDFGRTLYMGGEDHGWGGHAFVIGGAVRSGIYGNIPTIAGDTADTLANGALIPTTSADQYLATMVAWLTDNQMNLEKIFPSLRHFSQKTLPLWT